MLTVLIIQWTIGDIAPEIGSSAVQSQEPITKPLKKIPPACFQVDDTGKNFKPTQRILIGRGYRYVLREKSHVPLLTLFITKNLIKKM